MGSVNLEADAARKRMEVVEWLNGLFPDFGMRLDASEDELKARLFDGTVLCAILSRLSPSSAEGRVSDYLSSEHRLVKIKRFLSVIEEMGLPAFKLSDLEQGSISAVVVCLLAIRDHHLKGADHMAKYGRNRWRLAKGSRLEPLDVSKGDHILGGQNSGVSEEDRRRNLWESNYQRVLRSPDPLSPSTAFLHHIGHKFHEVFQLKQGGYADLPDAKISEMMKSNSLDNAPTQSLLSVVNGILDESIERKNGEIPHRVACLLRKVVQEIERRISTQAEHIRNQNNLIKAREEKYQSRIRVLETLATGTSVETQVVNNHFQQIKTEKTKIEDKGKLEEQDVTRLMKEKENSTNMITELKRELEIKEKLYEEQRLQLESKATESKRELENRIKEVESCLAESTKRSKELEAFSESKFQNWNKKEHIFGNFIGFQLQSVQILRVASESIKHEVINTQRRWSEEFSNFGLKMKVLTDAAENYQTVLAENRKLYNEVQELKGNIRVYCRIRPFLHGQSGKSTTVEYIGEDGELLVVNPSKQGKDAQRMFKFNKVYGPSATQEEVYIDTQPLIRSVLDGYNVCIFAYGQTGSGKTYTMSGPDSASKVDWGVNYRALNDLFHISQTRKSTYMYEVGVQMVEIYNEQVRDLFANDGSQKSLGILHTAQPNGLAVPDAIMHPVSSTSDVVKFMEVGHANRARGATALNERSSRSHSVVTVHVRGVDLKTGATNRGSLYLVDLAGSERVDRSEVTGDRLKEAQHINKSLSALGDVIFALSQKNTHVPYRNSKLTQVLQSSLGGQAKTLMFVQINPDVGSYSETLSTLKFAERVSGVELGTARSNREGKDVRDLMEQVASLKDTIARKDEEIEQLQLLKDIRSQSPTNNGGTNGSNSLRHSASSPGMLSIGGTNQQGRRLSSGTSVRRINKAASEPNSLSDHSDKHSDGSHQSLDDFRHPKVNFGQSKVAGENTDQIFPSDIEIAGFGDADSEDRLSDISDGTLSVGTETEGPISSVVESTLFPENVKQSDGITAKSSRTLSKVPKLLPKRTAQATSLAPKLQNSMKTSRSRTTTIQPAPSLSRPAKRWP